jgi:hypothetical protein
MPTANMQSLLPHPQYEKEPLFPKTVGVCWY